MSNFVFFAYNFNPNQPPKELVSTLTHFSDVPEDRSVTVLNNEYEKVGQDSFVPQLLPNIV